MGTLSCFRGCLCFLETGDNFADENDLRPKQGRSPLSQSTDGQRAVLKFAGVMGRSSLAIYSCSYNPGKSLRTLS